MKIDNQKLIDAILENLHYCKETGNIYRKKSAGKIISSFIDELPAGFVMNNGYRALKVGGERIFCHRAAFVLVNKRLPDANIDHINGDRLDNRWENLRECSPLQNSQNQVKLKTRDAASKYLGVCFSKQKRKWIASIQVNNKKIFLGAFRDELEAANAYKNAKLKHHTFNPSVRTN